MIPIAARALFLLALCTSALAPLARAGGQSPASLLLFPEFDNRPGQVTYLTLTNVNSDTQNGAIDVHLIYVNEANCLQTDVFVHMTARDTVTILTSAQVPGAQRGYAWAVAVNPVTHQRITFDYLVGALCRIDGVQTIDWSVQPLGFKGLTAPGTSTEINNNGRPDLNGIEYERAPNRFYVPRFFGQTPEPAPRGGTFSDLILLQPMVGTGVTTNVAFLTYNDNEEVFSASYSFVCWKRVRLLAISGVFSQSFLASSNDNSNEVIGAPAIETGWFQVRGVNSIGPAGQSTSNPPVFGVLVELRPNSAADLPWISTN